MEVAGEWMMMMVKEEPGEGLGFEGKFKIREICRWKFNSCLQNN